MRSPGTKNLDQLDINDPRTMDRLVDGELTDEQERAVIAQLEQVPDGWQRCALAFLETRCWQREVTRWQPHTGGQQEAVRPLSPTTRPRHLLGSTLRWPEALVLSAVFLFALAMGRLLPGPWHRSSPQPTHRPPSSAPRLDAALAHQEPPAAAPVHSQELLLGSLTLVDHSGRQFQLPVYDWNQQVAEQLMYRSQPLSTEFVQHVRRHQVRSHQSYLPVQLKDGRQVVFPVQEVDIAPVVRTAY